MTVMDIPPFFENSKTDSFGGKFVCVWGRVMEEEKIIEEEISTEEVCFKVNGWVWLG